MSCSYVSSSETLKPCLIGSDARGNVSVQSVAGGEVEEKSGRVATLISALRMRKASLTGERLNEMNSSANFITSDVVCCTVWPCHVAASWHIHTVPHQLHWPCLFHLSPPHSNSLFSHSYSLQGESPL